MEELNKEEIIKALEWCIQSEGCEYCEYNKGNIDVCSIRSDALALIKDQDEQIFKLQNLLKENENGYAQTLFLEKCKNKDLTEKNKELQEENKSLAKTVNEASDLIRKQSAKINRLKAYDEERDIALHARLVRETKQEVAREIIDEFKTKVLDYVKDKGLLLVAFKNAVAQAEADLKKKYIGEKGE